MTSGGTGGTAPRSSTTLLFHDDPTLLAFRATVLERRAVNGRPAVVLDQTAFYATSGGQPHDKGTLNDVPVEDVLFDGDVVLHVLARPLDDAAATVEGRVDPVRRRDHMQQHHGQHLLSRAFVETCGASTVAFHLGATESTIDLDRLVGPDGTATAERRANEIVRSARPVGFRTLTREACAAEGIPVPDEAAGEVRIVDVDGWDVQPCSGTHPRRTSEVGLVLVLGHERYKAGTRVRFACGDRALATVARWRDTLGRTASLLSSSVAEVGDAVERLLAERTTTDKALRDAREQLAAHEARELAARAEGGIVAARLDGRPAAELRTLAQQVVASAPVLALLGGVESGRAHLVFAQADGGPHDPPALLRSVLALVDGKGGGRGSMAQGGGARVDGLDEALAQAARTARG